MSDHYACKACGQQPDYCRCPHEPLPHVSKEELKEMFLRWPGAKQLKTGKDKEKK